MSWKVFKSIKRQVKNTNNKKKTTSRSSSKINSLQSNNLHAPFLLVGFVFLEIRLGMYDELSVMLWFKDWSSSFRRFSYFARKFWFLFDLWILITRSVTSLKLFLSWYNILSWLLQINGNADRYRFIRCISFVLKNKFV